MKNIFWGISIVAVALGSATACKQRQFNADTKDVAAMNGQAMYRFQLVGDTISRFGCKSQQPPSLLNCQLREVRRSWSEVRAIIQEIILKEKDLSREENAIALYSNEAARFATEVQNTDRAIANAQAQNQTDQVTFLQLQRKTYQTEFDKAQSTKNLLVDKVNAVKASLAAKSANVKDIESFLSNSDALFDTVNVKSDTAASIYGSYLYLGMRRANPNITVSHSDKLQSDDVIVLKSKVTNPRDSLVCGGRTVRNTWDDSSANCAAIRGDYLLYKGDTYKCEFDENEGYAARLICRIPSKESTVYVIMRENNYTGESLASILSAYFSIESIKR